MAQHPLDTALTLACPDFIERARLEVQHAGIVRAVADRNTAGIFDWLISMYPLQGISDSAAMKFQLQHGGITWSEIEAGLSERGGGCPRLRSWWHFKCGYRKGSGLCAEPDFFERCALPRHNLRKGALNVAAFGTFLFFRDVCEGDVVGWIDQRLEQADRSSEPDKRGRRMVASVVEPLAEISGVGPKVLSMALADLLLAADPNRERWTAAGAAMIAVDTLVHAWLHRTGTLRQFDAEHSYGPNCYKSDGCTGVIEQIANRIDARTFNPTFPQYFPRLIQTTIWEFCAEGGWNICNGRQINDHRPCAQPFCPARPGCARLPLHKMV